MAFCRLLRIPLALKANVQKLAYSTKSQKQPRIERESIPKLRFIQFLRKNDTRKRLGVVSQDGSHFIELTNSGCIANDMTSFIRQGISMQEISKRLSYLRLESVTDDVKLLPCISNAGKIIGIGKNYVTGSADVIPKAPSFYGKFNNCLVGPMDDIIVHDSVKKMDFEVVLAVVIGKPSSMVKLENAMNHVYGYTIAQDITARDWQTNNRNSGQWLMAKSMDSFCPLGPSITHKSLLRDVYNLDITTSVNGVVKQQSNTGKMIFKIEELISRLSRWITLMPGDIILTGSPPGSGITRNPPEYLQPGDVIESEIQCMGRIVNRVVAKKEYLEDVVTNKHAIRLDHTAMDYPPIKCTFGKPQIITSGLTKRVKGTDEADENENGNELIKEKTKAMNYGS